ncbi:hypothetical protein EZV62_007098 [Acer yangbiense]|uniref:Rieske domain-containing protein n=1 Tax=Acer yangbiense TaxID=1000413 RepID=A0A5C7I8C5_9ROSI|nr:hypothetical protein EZV62_007098 [Acer yangbiense]
MLCDLKHQHEAPIVIYCDNKSTISPTKNPVFHEKVDREGGKPLQVSVKKLDINGFVGRQEWGCVKFTAPCTFCMYTDPVDVQAIPTSVFLRYRSHVVNCRSCSSAYKALTALEVILQIVSIVSIGFVTATKQSFIPTTVRTNVVTMAVVCFAASRWLAHFIYKNFHYHDYNHALQSCFSSTSKNTSRSTKVFTSLSSSSKVLQENVDPSEAELETETPNDKFEWFSQWYPVMPVCELDKRVPLPKKILGLDVVVWWDRNENTWKVFDDTCPHRLAPLSQGRIDQWGRLQCVYHGWCFNGTGDCKFVPQATPDGPPIHTSKKACARVYPTTVQHETVWFWPSTDPKYKEIIKKKKPPFIPELDDPSFTNSFINRDIPCGYEIIVENLMDPAHVPYSHYGVMQLDKPPKVKADREGGQPLELSVKKLDVNGFVGRQEWGSVKFIAPCTYCMYADDDPVDVQGNGSAKSTGTDEALVRPKLSGQQRMVFFFFCIPVSPGNCRLIWGTAKNFGSWIENIIPKWIRHILSNLVVDSDLYLLHIEERKIMEVGAANWQKECFVPTRSDALVVCWWSNQLGWKIQSNVSSTNTTKRTAHGQVTLVQTQNEVSWYWSHVVNCKSCSYAYKSLNTLEVSLQVITVVSIGIVAATKQGVMSAAARTMVVSMAIVCFVASRWLAHFIYKNFHYHDYNHSFH